MRSRERRHPERLGDILQGLLKSRGFPRANRSRELYDAWHRVAADTAGRTSVAGFRAGVVKVEVESAALHHELSCFRKQELLAALRAALPNAGIRDLVFRQA